MQVWYVIAPPLVLFIAYLRIGFAHHHSACLGGVLSFPDHRDDGAGRHEVAEAVVKWFILRNEEMNE